MPTAWIIWPAARDCFTLSARNGPTLTYRIPCEPFISRLRPPGVPTGFFEMTSRMAEPNVISSDAFQSFSDWVRREPSFCAATGRAAAPNMTMQKDATMSLRVVTFFASGSGCVVELLMSVVKIVLLRVLLEQFHCQAAEQLRNLLLP